VVILALDTTTRAGSVAVTDDDMLLAVVDGDASRTHGERLPGEIARALAEAGLTSRELALLAVAVGPGAFTGLRIGLAAIQGLAMVLEIPVVGVSALDALAWEASAVRRDEERHVITWMDAQRGEVFAAHYVDPFKGDGGGEPAGEPDTGNDNPAHQASAAADAASSAVVGHPDAVLSLWHIGQAEGVIAVGDGAVRYRGALEARYGECCRVIDTPLTLGPAVARIGRRAAARGLAGPPHALQPLYVRRPDAELERQRRLES
jgi:tRNA threonylcarbamoyladenosine biosynthesis protein TsaB